MRIQQALLSIGGACMLAVLMSTMPAVVVAQEAASETPPLCELRLEGRSIQSLHLEKTDQLVKLFQRDEMGQPVRKQNPAEDFPEGEYHVTFTIDRGDSALPTFVLNNPNEVIRLPAGKYRITELVLEGGYQYRSQSGEGKHRDHFELTPDRPYVLKLGAPLVPTVDAVRQGGTLKLSYDLVDADGRSYTTQRNSLGQRPSAPQFAVYQGERQIGSGSFEYG